MVSTLTPANQEFLNKLEQITARINLASLQITSGVRMRQVSDAPDQVSALLEARAALAASQQISTNFSRLKGEVDAGEQALQSAVQLFDQVQTAAATGVTGTQTASSRADLAQQIQSIEQQMVGLANTNLEGRFIFSGDSDQTAPYSYDATLPNPVSAYQGSAATRAALHPNGTTFRVALAADQILDSSDPATNVFSTLNALITALQNNDETGIQAVNTGLSRVGDYLNQQLAFYGTTQNQVSSATDFAKTQQTQLQTQIGVLEDTDVSSAILDLTQAQTQQQAALSAQGRIPRTTLFDFLA